MEFDGHLSISDIYNMTYKEIDILRKHRRKYGKNYHANKEVMKMFGGMGDVVSGGSDQIQGNPSANITVPPIPGKYNTNLSNTQ